MNEQLSIFWFRRDLRLDDNAGLHYALQGKYPILPIFIFDSEILDTLPKNDARVNFIHDTLQKIREQLLKKYGGGMALYFGNSLDIFNKITSLHRVKAVYTNHDYEPYARLRDKAIKKYLSDHGIEFNTYKDQVIFEKDEVVKKDGDPYLVYTPYMKKWKSRFHVDRDTKNYPCPAHFGNLAKIKNLPILTLHDIGFKPTPIKVPDFDTSPTLIQKYKTTRDYPSNENGTSRVGPHLRFGTVSVRKMVKMASLEKNETFMNELIWREFFMQILWHFPNTVHRAFKPQYDRIAWRNNENDFEKWKKGKTGYTLVDAGMRQLNTTGYMHNRVRMLAASFLCKHLLIDWRWGEAYFAEKLLDYEMSSNVGNWQWAAGSGVDAAPYFRIFNPMTQAEKFDMDKTYVKKWVPDYDGNTYPPKMVDHKEARERCMKVYMEALR
ncbi:DNA photolyase family protein [Flavobacteriaceae bacterium F89]|uniref:DNA photolyase family protein n=1 Tax=Cerina litoralis TaxID=2874477 RepID=A0AAE3JQM9_9FLAO|nr:deoxyribodipyrimidine photo-lyase [Cerina litoralis]MCG2462029.1 DNA photolyase family protein [Cerina litoralis]